MELIHVPRSSKTAMNPDRPANALLLAQVSHFQHAERQLPLTWGATENIRWKADLPGRGLSNPVIAGGRIFVTASSGWDQKRLHVLCFEEGSGNYDHRDAAGFIRLNALRLRTIAQRKRRLKA